MKVEEELILIAGPTASGKTRHAIELAKANDALILNADSMQVYRELRTITARPSNAEENEAPHKLFGHVKGNAPYSVAHWLEDVRPFLSQGKKLVLVGGTGLYFNALLDGLSPMPEIKPEIREKWRGAHGLSNEELHSNLDKAAAQQLLPNDTQRVIRALEVYESTGQSIIEWQNLKGESIIPSGMKVRKFLKMPERAVLHERINLRFDMMLDDGALEEVEALLQLNYLASVPVMKAIGVPHLGRYIAGELPLKEAIENAKAASRQYAKRQSTWFRNSFGDGWETL